MKTKFAVRILPREVILDTQGRAVGQTLKQGGYGDISVRVGKYIELEIDGSEAEALPKAKTIAEKLLANPLIETFKVETLKAEAGKI